LLQLGQHHSKSTPFPAIANRVLPILRAAKAAVHAAAAAAATAVTPIPDGASLQIVCRVSSCIGSVFHLLDAVRWGGACGAMELGLRAVHSIRAVVL